MLILSVLRRIPVGFQRFFSTKNAFFPPPRRSEMEVFGRIGRIFGIGREGIVAKTVVPTNEINGRRGVPVDARFIAYP